MSWLRQKMHLIQGWKAFYELRVPVSLSRCYKSWGWPIELSGIPKASVFPAQGSGGLPGWRSFWMNSVGMHPGHAWSVSWMSLEDLIRNPFNSQGGRSGPESTIRHHIPVWTLVVLIRVSAKWMVMGGMPRAAQLFPCDRLSFPGDPTWVVAPTRC